MPTQTLIPYVESPDGIGHDILNHSSATMPGSGSSMTPHISLAEKTDVQAAGCPTLDCMFCEETFQHEKELSLHLLSQHPTTLHAPAVLRVEAEFLAPGEKTCSKAEPEEELSCVVCGQATEGAAELEAHMRKHKDSFTYCCNLCGRRFKEPWFLKNHMRTHGKSGARNKNHDLEAPATINDVVQDQPAPPVATVYKMCMVCGFFFLNKEALAEHSKVHSREPEAEEIASPEFCPVREESASKECLLNYLKLEPAVGASRERNLQPGRWISQLDPFNTYQAWQLATKGKIAVGPNLNKELNAESNTDNDDSGSDKEELGSIWDSNGGDKAGKRGFRGELKPKIIGGESQAPLPVQKSLMRKDKPTICEDCGKTFRTYHQLVLHSRVHKRERGGAESPTTAIDGRTTSVSSAGSPTLDRAEEASEDGSEEGVAVETFHPDKGEDGKMKLKILAPRKCCYCGKTFRSNYYLNIHLRTHTGEKPYKCEHCDYAAAQKTSLRYHLDRRHKDKPFTEIPNVPVTVPAASVARSHESGRNTDDKQASKPAKQFPAPSPVSAVTSEPASCQPAVDTSAHVKEECGIMSATTPYTPPSKASLNCPLPLNLKAEDKEAIQAPLNLSLKASLSVSATLVPRNMLLTNTCTSCPYETLYPEVLLMHRKLIHKEKMDMRKNNYRPPVKLKRYTGCPPALEGKDVTPLPHINRKHPRRTKSPAPQPARAGDKVQTPKPPQPPQRSKVSPVKEPWKDHQHVTQRSRTAEAAAAVQPRFSEPVPEPGRKFSSLPVQTAPVQMAPKPGPTRNSVIFPSDAARLCLSDRFRSLTQMDFGEPSSKRLKPSEPQQGAVGISDKFHRLVPSGRDVKSLMQGNLPVAPVRVAPSTSGGGGVGVGGVEPDWNMINLLRSYTPSKLATLYQPLVHGSGHDVGSLPAGSRPLVFPHYTASISQRRSHPGALPNNRSAPPDATS